MWVKSAALKEGERDVELEEEKVRAGAERGDYNSSHNRRGSFARRSWISEATEQSRSRGAHGKAEVNHPFPDSPHVKGIRRCIVGMTPLTPTTPLLNY